MTAKEISWLLAVRGSSPFKVRRHIAVVPNVSWGLLPWEADLLVLRNTGYLVEIEIKISLQDWKADFEKTKHKWLAGNDQWIREFYYAAPKKLAERWQELNIPEYAGVISVDEKGIEVLRSAHPRKPAKKLTEEDQKRLLRLAAIKAWGLFHRPTIDTTTTRST